MLLVGLMSGTSMDGIDAVLIKTDGTPKNNERLGHIAIPYDPRFKILLKAAELAVRKNEGDMAKAEAQYQQFLVDYLRNELKMQEYSISAKITDLSSYLHKEDRKDKPITLDEVIQHSTQLHIKAVKELLKETQHEASQIDVVGYHGQTLFHRPSQKISIIVGDGQVMADQLGIPVVNDFRRCDVESGGQGAPFAPIYHQALAIRDNKIPLAVVNCGGISNITIIRDDQPENLIGFDTGPGNGLIDGLVRERTEGRENMDKDGKYGKAGQVNEQVLQALRGNALIIKGQNYLLKAPPKALDIGDMARIPELDTLSIEDACATLAAFTADCIIRSVEELKIKLPTNWILAGGGWYNPVIRNQLEIRLKTVLGQDVKIFTADEAGWNTQSLEAEIFAYFALRSLRGESLSVSGTTGVPQPLTGGHAYIPGDMTKVTPAVQELLERNPAVLNGYQTVATAKAMTS